MLITLPVVSPLVSARPQSVPEIMAGRLVVLANAPPSMLILQSPVAGVQSALTARSMTPRFTIENGMVTAVAYLTGRVAKTSSPPTSVRVGDPGTVSPKSKSRDTLRPIRHATPRARHRSGGGRHSRAPPTRQASPSTVDS